MSEGRDGVGDISFWVDDCLFSMFVPTYLDTTGKGIHTPRFGFFLYRLEDAGGEERVCGRVRDSY